MGKREPFHILLSERDLPRMTSFHFLLRRGLDHHNLGRRLVQFLVEFVGPALIHRTVYTLYHPVQDPGYLDSCIRRFGSIDPLIHPPLLNELLEIEVERLTRPRVVALLIVE